MSVGNIHHKDRFLNQIAAKLGRERIKEPVKRPTWKHEPQKQVFEGYSQDQLVEVLKNQCILIHTNVEVVQSVLDIPSILDKIIAEIGAKSIVSWNDPRFDQYDITSYFQKVQERGMDVHVWNEYQGDENIQKAEQAHIGITFSDLTLAESGTVVLFSNNGKGRSVSLLPMTYIAIIPKSTIVPRMTQATSYIHQIQQETGKVPSCINFISGPSNSADIEMNLVVGVHGPIQAFYIIVDDI